MGRPSRYCPDEFRREAVQMASATDDSRAPVARRLGVNETTLRNWWLSARREARQANPLSVSPSKFEELRRLREEVAELRIEKEILRKAAAFFAQETIRSAASDSSPSTETPTGSSCCVEFSESHARAATPSRPGRPRRAR